MKGFSGRYRFYGLYSLYGFYGFYSFYGLYGFYGLYSFYSRYHLYPYHPAAHISAVGYFFLSLTMHFHGLVLVGIDFYHYLCCIRTTLLIT